MNLYNLCKRKAFINGKIFTADKNNSIADTVLVQGGIISYVGSKSESGNLIDSNTDIIDLKGKLMLPGFVDAHTHFIDGGFYLLGLDLRHAKSESEFVDILKSYAEQNKTGWITGGSWNQENWENPVIPRKESIDLFTKNIPVFIERLDKHMGLANSLALNLAGITKDTVSPEDGTIEKDPLTGEPTGILKDNAMRFIYSVIPEKNRNDLRAAALSALNEARKYGVTGIHDISLPEHLSVFQELFNEGKLTCRIFSRLPIKEYENFASLGIHAGFGNKMLSAGSLKAFADGSLGAGTAWFFEPYSDNTENYGLPMEILANGRLKNLISAADRKNLQISVHAIGDRTNSELLNIFENVIKENPEWDRRFRIEHAQHLKSSDAARFAKLGIIASMQPYHMIDDLLQAEKKIGTRRIKDAFRFRSLLDEKVKLSFGSDWPVAPLNPLTGIYAAVTRGKRNPKYPEGFVPGQKIAVEEAIRCYTINNAYSSFEEKIKGSIEAGKLADFAVLEEDILTSDPDKIMDTNAAMTILNGEIIYERKD